MNRMKELRESQQITMKEAARRLDMPYTTYVNYEKSLREPNSETLIQIANFYNCSIDYLLGKSDNRIDDTLLDAVSETDTFLLTLVGNPRDAKKIEDLFNNYHYREAREYLYSIIAPDVIKLAEEMHLTISDTDPQIDELVRNAEQLNAQGKQKLVDYSDDLLGNPVYQKQTPGGSSASDGV